MTTIRLAQPQDLPLLGPIEDAADRMFAQRFGAVDWPGASPGEERAGEPGFILVAARAVEGDGGGNSVGEATVVGFTHVLDLDGHWHLEQIAVDPAHGRRGIGAELLEETHRELVRRGATEVTLMTYADVPWNAPFYAQHGYVELDPLPPHLVPLREDEALFDLARHGRRVAMVRYLSGD